MQSIRHSNTEEKVTTKIHCTACLQYLITLKFNNISTKEIERIIKSIRVKNSHGYDGITTKMLKVSAPYISSPLNSIYNKSILS
jgi:hypothetical protein